MKSFKAAIQVTAILAALLAASGDGKADDISAGDREVSTVEVRALLEKGQASEMLPQGMVVRLSACLGILDQDSAGKGIPDHLLETWEFTSNQVRRVVMEKDKEDKAVERFESRPFDSKEICKDLLKGQVLEIHAGKGTGPDVAFAGSPYRRGSRSIEVLMNGKVILQLHETNGPFLKLYAETDARAFGALYDRLARQARQKFPSNVAEDK